MKKDSLLKHSILIILSLIWLSPIYLLIVNAFANVDTWESNFDWSIKGWEPIQNFQQAWTVADLSPGLKSNFFYGILGAGLSVFFASLAAFSIVALNPKNKTLWFWVIYAVNLVPYQMLLLPLFESFAATGLYDTRWGLLTVYIAIAIPFAFFLSRNHMLSISKEVVEASQLDGASKIQTYFKIFLPLSWSALGAAFLFQFTWIWNDLVFGLTLTTSAEIRPLMTTIAGLVGQYQSIKMPIVLCATLIASLPTAFLYIVGQRLFVAGLKAGS
jgi:multiple sugar transport system permease protein